ncbi:LOW QUALITY PROTEIN: peroxisome biogenesis factor 2-like [Penaeus chinensis]|uniref:LOW QUALITY PROTEIN: peroxisome biogenesis factor 2-like n=1 Tax=Penaeus chinensis TaxID=139456 RepID=UPI001FB6964F|nr:LOW QUALITY PROTEIN: peroxisome biogenesis factor 2-like [Penaeus chinensis]
MSPDADTAEEKGFVPRISQLDSIILTEEAYSLIKSQVLSAVKYAGQNVLTKLEPEIEAGLRYVLLRYTVQEARRSVGQQLLQIKYEDSVPVRRLRHYVRLLVFVRWIRQRAGDVAAVFFKNENARVIASRVVNQVEILYKMAEVMNLLVFLHQGVYPSVIERVLGLKPVSSSVGNVRTISYVYFTRELLWHGFAELLAFVLPLINLQYFHNVVRKMLPSSVDEEDDDNDIQQEINFNHQTTCVVCNSLPILPHNFGCQHLACYYCIHSSYVSDPTFTCPLCDHTIESKVQIIPMYTVES